MARGWIRIPADNGLREEEQSSEAEGEATPLGLPPGAGRMDWVDHPAQASGARGDAGFRARCPPTMER